MGCRARDGADEPHDDGRPLRLPPARGRAARNGQRTERGSATLLKVMIFLALRCGRPVAHGILRVIAAYFFAFAPSARRSAREYLRRALGHKPSAIDRYRQVFAFASTILDRLYLVRERYGLFEISTEGEELMHDMVARGSGAFLLGAHLGSFEIRARWAGVARVYAVAMAMYEHNASRVAAFFKAAGNPASAPEDHRARAPRGDAADPRLPGSGASSSACSPDAPSRMRRRRS